MKQTNPHRLATLDSLRGIAAVSVVLFHLTLHQPDAPFHLTWGVTGVDLFFIISGFVILLTLQRTRSAQDFIIARFSRLYPVYWSAVTFTALCMLLGSIWGYSDVSNDEYWANMTMFQHYFGVRDLDESYWTLLVEMLFYGLMLLCFLAKQLGNIEKIGCIAVLFQILVHTLLKQHLPTVCESLHWGFPILNHLQLFWAGILFYKIFTEGQTIARWIGLFVSFITTLLLFEQSGRSFLFISFEGYLLTTTLYYVLFGLFVGGRLEWINNRVTLFFGAISYSLYVIHHYFLNGFQTILQQQWGWSFWPSAVFALVSALIIATFITNFIEKPALKFIRSRYFKSSKAPEIVEQYSKNSY
ncbi:MAG: acyltransferase family protein [Runella sp.]